MIKSLYSLKRINNQCYEKLASLFTLHGYKQVTSYNCLFIKSKNLIFIIFLVHGDDVILAGNSLSEFQHMKYIMHKTFNIKDLSIIKYFLGLEVEPSK